jgi:uncharacterized membrane protein
MSENKKNILIITLLVILNIVVKSIYVGTNNLDVDEPFSIYMAQSDITDLLKTFQTENNPPFFYLILHFWVKLFGISALSVRFLPMLFSSFAVIFIYLIGNKFYGKTVAICASLLYTFSNLNILEAHDTRAYSLFVLLSSISMYQYLKMIYASKKRKHIIILTITNIILVFSHFFGLFVVLLQIAYILLIPGIRPGNVKKYSISLVIFAISYMPYFAFIFQRMINSTIEGRPFETTTLSNILSGVWSFSNYDNILLFLFLGILTAYYIALILTKTKPSDSEWIIVGWFIILYTIMQIISVKIGITTPKYLIYMTPGFYLAVSITIFQLFNNSKLNSFFSRRMNPNILKFAGYLVMAVCILKMITSSDLKGSNYYGSAEAVSIVKQHKSDSTFVFLAPAWISLNFSYYYNQTYFKDYKNLEARLIEENIYRLNSENDLDTLNIKAASDAIFIGGQANGLDFIDPDNKIFNSVAKKFGTGILISKLPGYTIYHFGPPIVSK